MPKILRFGRTIRMPQGIGNLTQSLSPVRIYPGSVVIEKHHDLTGVQDRMESEVADSGEFLSDTCVHY